MLLSAQVMSLSKPLHWDFPLSIRHPRGLLRNDSIQVSIATVGHWILMWCMNHVLLVWYTGYINVSFLVTESCRWALVLLGFSERFKYCYIKKFLFAILLQTSCHIVYSCFIYCIFCSPVSGISAGYSWIIVCNFIQESSWSVSLPSKHDNILYF